MKRYEFKAIGHYGQMYDAETDEEVYFCNGEQFVRVVDLGAAASGAPTELPDEIQLMPMADNDTSDLVINAAYVRPMAATVNALIRFVDMVWRTAVRGRMHHEENIMRIEQLDIRIRKIETSAAIKVPR